MPLELVAALQQARAETTSSIGLRTLNPHQNATVTLISELIIPQTDTPGAKAAKVNEFIDLLLTEWFDQADTARFLAGLAAIDAESRKSFGKALTDCSPSQQTQLMKQFDGEAMEFVQSQKLAEKTHAPQQDVNFFYTLKKLTLVGYYTSQTGSEARR
jgi:Gluconate 2-dehydrogenase subunit 3